MVPAYFSNPNGPPDFKSLISREAKVGLTSNQAENLSLSDLETYIKKFVSLDHEGTLEGLFCQWSPEKKIRGVNRLIKEVESEYSVLEDS